MTDHPQKPMTHTAWTPFFDEDGKFVYSVEIGPAIIETDTDGAVTAQIFRRMQVIGYDSGYIYLAPHGQKPPASPPEILENARFDAQENKNSDFGVAV